MTTTTTWTWSSHHHPRVASRRRLKISTWPIDVVTYWTRPSTESEVPALVMVIRWLWLSRRREERHIQIVHQYRIAFPLPNIQTEVLCLCLWPLLLLLSAQRIIVSTKVRHKNIPHPSVCLSSCLCSMQMRTMCGCCWSLIGICLVRETRWEMNEWRVWYASSTSWDPFIYLSR